MIQGNDLIATDSQPIKTSRRNWHRNWKASSTNTPTQSTTSTTAVNQKRNSCRNRSDPLRAGLHATVANDLATALNLHKLSMIGVSKTGTGSVRGACPRLSGEAFSVSTYVFPRLTLCGPTPIPVPFSALNDFFDFFDVYSSKPKKGLFSSQKPRANYESITIHGWSNCPPARQRSNFLQENRGVMS